MSYLPCCTLGVVSLEPVRIYLLIFLFCCPGYCYPQEHPDDTTGFYHKLYHYSKEKKLLFLVYKTIFNVPAKLSPEPVYKNPADHKEYLRHHGKIIRNITIVSLEPFGASLHDSAQAPLNFIQRAGNALHFNTRRQIIASYLQFAEGEPLDPLLVNESERLLRNSRFIRDAEIIVRSVPNSPGMVDVTVITRDLFTISVSTVVTSDKLKVRVSENDMFGLGHRFSNRIEYDFTETDKKDPALTGSYLVPNLGNTFASAEAKYSFAPDKSIKGFIIDRPFYSAYTRYAGGIEYENSNITDSTGFVDTGYEKYRYISNETGVWFGRSFALMRGKTVEEKSTRLVVAGSFNRIRFPKLFTTSSNLLSVLVPVDLYLASAGYSNRKYYTDRYIFQFGEKEDVPSGRILKFTTGYEYRNHVGYYYTGGEAGGSGYLNNGSYLSTDFKIGTFWGPGGAERGVARGDLFFFSKLHGGDAWKMRWFANVNFTAGFNRTANEVILLTSGDWIPGYRNAVPRGTSRLAGNITAVVFNPFRFIGFRISPLLFAGAGLAGDSKTPIQLAKLYKGIGGGFAFTNVYLVQSDFKILFGYYPDIKNNQTRVSSFDAWEFGFRDFNFGRPGTAEFE